LDVPASSKTAFPGKIRGCVKKRKFGYRFMGSRI
jgi:hypothetical protein